MTALPESGSGGCPPPESPWPADERRQGWYALVGVALLWLVAAAWGSGKGYYPCYDSGAYVTVSRALVAGEGYVEGNHPEKPPFIVYPPGYVVPLVAAMKVFGEDWRVLRLASVVPFGLAALLLIPWAFGRRLPPWQWPIAGLVLGFGGMYLWALRIQAEIPYLFWTMLTVGFADRAIARRRLLSREAVLAILFGVVAIWTKPMALILPFVVGAEAMRVGHVRFHGTAAGTPGRIGRSLAPIGFAVLLAVVMLVPYAVHLARIQPDVLDPAKTHVMQKNWWDPDAGQRSFLSVENFRHVTQSAWDSLLYHVPWSFLIRSENTWSIAKNRAVAAIGWLVLLGLARRIARREWDGYDWLVLGQAGLISSMPNQHHRYYVVVGPALVVSFLGGLSGVGELLAWPFRRFAPRAPAVAGGLLVFLGSLPLLAYEARDVRQYRDWGEAWSDRSLNVFIGEAAAARAGPGDVLLVDDHYGIHAITGKLALSFHPAQRKSMTGFGVEEYLARSGRVDIVATQVGEWEMARSLYGRFGWEPCDVDRTDWYVTARLRRKSAGGCLAAGELPEESGTDEELESAPANEGRSDR